MREKKRKKTGNVTLNDVAKLANVGPMTVSRVIRQPNLVSTELKERVYSAITALNYTPNQAASMLASAKNQKMVVIIYAEIYDYCSQKLLSMIETELSEYYAIIKIQHGFIKEYEFLQNNSILIILFNIELTQQEKSYLVNIPLISIGYSHDSCINIGNSNFDAMYQLTHFMVKSGYRNIGLICANKELAIFQKYLHGFHKAMLEHHLSSHRIASTLSKADYESGAKIFPDFLLNWPDADAVICTSDELACGILYESQRRKIKIPYQIAVASFGNSQISEICYPKLTTVSISYDKIKKMLLEYFLDTIKSGNAHKIDNYFLDNIEISINKRESS